MILKTTFFPVESIQALPTLIEPFFNFYGENQYSVKGIGIGNTGISYKNSLSGSLNNPATLFIDKKVAVEVVYRGNRPKVDWSSVASYHSYSQLDQDDFNTFWGIGKKVTEKLTAGITYYIEKNMQLIVEDNPVTETIHHEYVVTSYVDYINEVKQFSLTVPLSYQINTALSVGLSLKYSEFKHRFKNSIEGLLQESSSSVFTPQFGMLFSPKSFISFGVTYVPETKTFNISKNAYTFTGISVPSRFGIGATWAPIDYLSASLEYLYRNYSIFSDLDDQSSIRAGIEYNPIKLLSLRVGYVSSPSYIKNRTSLPFMCALDSSLCKNMNIGLVSTQELLTYGIGVNIHKMIVINASMQDSSFFDTNYINHSQYLANVQVNF